MKDPLPTLKQRNVVYHIPCSDCPNVYVGQTGRQLYTRVKEHKDAVRRQDENSLLVLHCLTTCHAFDWGGASVIGKGTTKHTRDLPLHVSINALHSTPATELYATIGGDEGKRIPQSVKQFLTPNLTPQPSPTTLFPCFYCFDKPDPNPAYIIYINLSLYPFNCTRNSLRHHLTKCRNYRLENL